jgi:hypothetical protein
MHIPQYWAEAKSTVTAGKTTATLRRFGWSNESYEEALRHAEQRVHDAAAQWRLKPMAVLRRETKVPYNGAEGMPIREEILDEGTGYVITRNSYGALCLNTPNVLIADVDIPTEVGLNGCLGKLLGWGLFPANSVPSSEAPKGSGPAFSNRTNVVRGRVLAFLEKHPDWSVRLYETPEGFRLIATQCVIEPTHPDASAFFQAVRADPIYVRMCKNQACFRARLTAKPWRCGLSERMHPRSVWPIADDQMPTREKWVAKYESVARNFASCRWLETIGQDSADPYIQGIVALHDRLCQAKSRLPLA